MAEPIHIIPFSPALAPHFYALNRAWLEKYFEVEPIDEAMLSDPQKYFIDQGGHIFFITLGNEVAGTFALIKESDTVYELSKMAVSEHHQGKNLGNKMLDFCLAKAKELGATRVFLFSNTLLQPAIHLYRKYGFTEIPVESSAYKRTNIKMERNV